jgi:hypothetical protein
MKFRDELSGLVASMAAKRASDAMETIDELLGRCHSPRGDDAGEVMILIDVLALEGKYSLNEFTEDCAAAVEIRNTKTAFDEAISKAAALAAERASIQAAVDEGKRISGDEISRFHRLANDIDTANRLGDIMADQMRRLRNSGGRAWPALIRAGLDLRTQ